MQCIDYYVRSSPGWDRSSGFMNKASITAQTSTSLLVSAWALVRHARTMRPSCLYLWLYGCPRFSLFPMPTWGTSPTDEQIDWPEHYRINFKRRLAYRINSVFIITTYIFICSFIVFLWLSYKTGNCLLPFWGPLGVRSDPPQFAQPRKRKKECTNRGKYDFSYPAARRRLSRLSDTSPGACWISMFYLRSTAPPSRKLDW